MKKIIYIVVIVAMIIGGKFLIDYKTFDASKVVNESLSAFYVNGNKEELKPIIELLEKYRDDEIKRENIQNSSSDIVGSWFMYLDDKYLCNMSNLNACKTQLDEFNALKSKLKVLYDYKSKDNFTIILPSIYTNLETEADKKIADLNKIIANPNAKNPLTSEEIHNRKCMVAVDCTNCRNGLCKCYYLDENKDREELTCQKNITN